jgi:hypothetical protein
LRASRLGEHAAFRLRPEDVEAWIDASLFEPPTKKAVGRRRSGRRVAAG